MKAALWFIRFGFNLIEEQTKMCAQHRLKRITFLQVEYTHTYMYMIYETVICKPMFQR